MAIQWGLRKLLDRKVWEMMTPAPVATAAGHFIITDPVGDDRMAMYFAGVSSIWRYDHNNDAWQQLPNSGLSGTHGAGSCGTFSLNGPTGTATAGTTTTITTNLSLTFDLVGYKIVITGGPNAGLVRTISKSTVGANGVITVSEPFPIAITTSSTYLLRTGRFWIVTAGTPDFGYYDRALNTWNVTPSITNLPASLGTDARLVSTDNYLDKVFVSGTATGGSATTLVDSTKTWTVGQWVNYQVRITSGSGAGRIMTITAQANGTTLTFATGTAISAGDTYVIEGNSDFLYLFGNNATTIYRYSISGNTWVNNLTVAPGTLGAGMGANWVFNVSHSDWNNESAFLNGKYIYVMRGGSSASLYRYSIPANTWETLPYWPITETFTTGSSWDYDGDFLYGIKDASGRLFRLNISMQRLFPLSTLVYPESTAVTGDKLWTKTLIDGDTKITWVYKLRNTGNELFRLMLIDNETNTSTGGWTLVEL